MTDPRNFLVNSDYPLDKVVYRTTGSFSLATYFDSKTTTIPHGLPFTPLVSMSWSTTSDFSVCYEAGSGPAPTDSTRHYLGITGDVYADATNIVINSSNFISSATTIYYRIFAFAPSTYTSDVSSTQDTGDNFVLNTDYNYTKLLTSGKLTLASTDTVTHSLGYIPQVQTWVEAADGKVYPPQSNMTLYYPGTAEVGVKTTTTTLVFSGLAAGYTYGHYRIYMDAQ